MHDKKEEPKFRLRQNVNDYGRVYINQVFVTGENEKLYMDQSRSKSANPNISLKLDVQKFKNPMVATKKDLIIAARKKSKLQRASRRFMNKTMSNVISKLNINFNPELQNVINDSNGSKNIKEMQYIQAILGRGKKKPLFELSPPRWKKSLISLHIPGPAYYSPILSASKISYNCNSNKWI